MQAVPAQAIVISLFNIDPLFLCQRYAIALALGDVPGLAFK